MTDRLFDLDSVPEVPLFREPRRARGAQVMDERLDHDYPPEWSKCFGCEGRGTVPDPEWVRAQPSIYAIILNAADDPGVTCSECLGMGSVKARVRLEAGHRCVRCKHPFMTKGDAKMLGVEPSPGRWSPCDEACEHGGLIASGPGVTLIEDIPGAASHSAGEWVARGHDVYAEWRVLTVHHLSGDKSSLHVWDLCALCQRCHLQVQSKVVLEKVYPHEHSEWFKRYAAGWYAWVYLNEDLGWAEIDARLDELLALERA